MVTEEVPVNEIKRIPCRSEAFGRFVTMTKYDKDHIRMVCGEVEIYGTQGMYQCSKENCCMYH